MLDRVDQFPDFDPRQHYALTVAPTEMTEVERNAASADEVTAGSAMNPRRPAAPGRAAPHREHARLAGLRPLQEAAIEPLLDGDDALLLAPTAGGKTEAAMFPLLSRMAAEQLAGTSVLYLCPLKALLNNLLPRLEQYAGWLGRRAALWHGDVGAAERRGDPARAARHPADHAGVAGVDARQRQRRPPRRSSPSCARWSSTRCTRSPATTVAGTCWPCWNG